MIPRHTTVTDSPAPPDCADLTDRLTPLLGSASGATAVAVAALRGGEQSLLCRGSADRTGSRSVDPATRFEVGSVTKTFTALVLAEAVARGDVSLNDPVARYLPPGTAPAHRSGEPITLLHLATHTSGLPRLPRGMLRTAARSWSSNPYGSYSDRQLLSSLAATRVRARPGSRVHYSNLGVGLLGRALAEAAGVPYAELLRDRVLEPLSLTRTTCDPGCAQATGYWHGRARPPWSIAALPGAGALRSTAGDLLRYLLVLLDPTVAAGRRASLAQALADVQRPRLQLPRTGERTCLVWSLRPAPGRDLFFHSGATRGFTAFIGFCPQARTGLAAVANTTPGCRSTFIQDAYTLLQDLAETAPR
ncbi:MULTISPECIES: serine hydrolase [Streptacidiphilus]|uniref:Serine hydrolase domain-containing protein n=1 Tax=Streptacidiphilus cavernicola TaxID=3342716 RepID=A0ABV6UVX0_9ACTN|nr:serine hydrolase domain-containing protein [Streptacidiphilus jeojiense]